MSGDTDGPRPQKLTDEELAVDVGDIDLPPDDVAAAMMAEEAAAPAGTAAVTATAKLEVAALDFVGGPPGVDIVLDHPFRLAGRVIDRVRVRPLTLGETGAVVSDSGDAIDVMSFYAAMTGLPVAVVRALPGRDGDRVTRAGYDFLPRFMRGSDG